MGQTNRNSKNGCATRLNYKKVKYPQMLLLKVHYETSVPFGQDRLIPICVATLALRQKSRTVHFERAAQMLEFFRFPKDGRYYRRMVQGFQRIFASTIFFGTEEQPSGSRLIDWARCHFFDQMHLWFAEHETCSSPPKDSPNTITLSEAFYTEIDQHRVPMEREVVIALANYPEFSISISGSHGRAGSSSPPG